MTSKRMSRAQTQYYMRRLDLFWSLSRIAEELEVNVLTVRRWKDGGSTPGYFMMDQFERALAQLCKDLSRRARSKETKFYERITEALIEDDCPDWLPPAITKTDTRVLRDYLVDELFGKTRKSSDVIKGALELGFSRPTIYKHARQLGVVMSTEKAGRSGWSEWRLPKRARK